MPQPTPDQRRALDLSFVRGVARFHDKGIVLGDSSHANVLWALDPEPEVYLLDCDGFHPVSGAPAQPQTETVDWSDPGTLLSETNFDSDAYKTALAVGRIVTQDPCIAPGHRLKPVPGRLDDDQLTQVSALFAKAAGERGTRPRVEDWYHALGGRGAAPPDVAQPPPRPSDEGPAPDGLRDREPINLRVSGR
ncbi:hypothetical protein ACFV30_19815 [Streptomyces sp. NPDC059752]|uniref:hypothetical protein n=1 Tax=unclassified Streptomyces TaxID=2593676 RepID=UPI00366883CC